MFLGNNSQNDYFYFASNNSVYYAYQGFGYASAQFDPPNNFLNYSILSVPVLSC